MEHARPQVVLFNLTFDLSIILTTTFAALLVFTIAYLCTRNLTDGVPKNGKILWNGSWTLLGTL